MRELKTVLTFIVAGCGVPSVALAQQASYRAVPLTQEELTRLREQVRSPGGPDGPGYDANWNTIDGGGATYLLGGSYELGATAGQPDAGFMSGGNYTIGGGFWYGVEVPVNCYANCDGSTGTPLLTSNDFQCFLNKFAAGCT
ncbi:MAG: hypothetical protein KF678_14415 [Phycisphaeraceae bacterium]|nr:hypothetical protein [Phycisphaeraceae bacterium]